MTPAGVFTEFLIPSPGNYSASIAAGADGNVWSTSGADVIGRITP